MFKPEDEKLVPVSTLDNSHWDIVEDYTVLLSEGDKDILYHGINRQGKIVLGSSMDEDYSLGIDADFRCLVSEPDFQKFVEGYINYPSLMRKSRRLYLVHTLKFVAVVYQISFDDIPTEYRPTEQAFYPKFYETK